MINSCLNSSLLFVITDKFIHPFCHVLKITKIERRKEMGDEYYYCETELVRRGLMN